MSTSRHYGFLLIRIAVIVILIILLLWKINIVSLLKYFDSQMLISILMVQPIVLVGLSIIVIRFSTLVGKPKPRFIHTFEAVILSYGLNNFIPGRISELLKATYLKDRAGIPIRISLAAIFLERMMDIVILCILALIGIILSHLYTNLFLLIAPLAVVFIILISLPRFEQFLVSLISHMPWKMFKGFLGDFISHSSSRLKEGNFFVAAIFGLAGWAVSLVTVAFFLNFAGNIPVGPVRALEVFVATTIGMAIPAIPGGFGTYEAGGVFVLTGFGYNLEEALAIAIALHVSQIITSVVGSFFIVAFHRIGFSSLVKQTIKVTKSDRIDEI
jgi:uncharacterized protein (TIRG00374 family)